MSWVQSSYVTCVHRAGHGGFWLGCHSCHNFVLLHFPLPCLSLPTLAQHCLALPTLPSLAMPSWYQAAREPHKREIILWRKTSSTWLKLHSHEHIPWSWLIRRSRRASSREADTRGRTWRRCLLPASHAQDLQTSVQIISTFGADPRSEFEIWDKTFDVVGPCNYKQQWSIYIVSYLFLLKIVL